MVITADLVKKLREKTNAPMMDCKKALEESSGYQLPGGWFTGPVNPNPGGAVIAL